MNFFLATGHRDISAAVQTLGFWYGWYGWYAWYGTSDRQSVERADRPFLLIEAGNNRILGAYESKKEQGYIELPLWAVIQLITADDFVVKDCKDFGLTPQDWHPLVLKYVLAKYVPDLKL